MSQSIFGIGMSTSILPLKYNNLVFGFHNYYKKPETVFNNAIDHLIKPIRPSSEFGVRFVNAAKLSHITALLTNTKCWIE